MADKRALNGIRPLRPEEVPQVARLFDLVRGAGGPERQSALTEFFRRTLMESPWADPELPSLVYAEGDELLGAISSNVRRMRFDGRPIRMVCSANLIVHPRARRLAVGARLMKSLLSGPQDLTITDGATSVVRRMWEGLGGTTIHVSCLSFIQLFRPCQLARDTLLDRGKLVPLAQLASPLAALLDRATGLVLKAPQAAERTLRVEPLTPAAILEHLPTVTKRLRLVPDYDLSYLDWLFRELAEVTQRGSLWEGGIRRGPVWAELVSRVDEPRGWYVCHLRPGGFCRLLQFAARREEAELVYDQLVERARQQGAAALYGRVEPSILEAIASHRTLIRTHPGRLLVHAHDDEIIRAIQSGQALLTRLDGEWW
jgi:Acetyltransferase (GNAT) domain